MRLPCDFILDGTRGLVTVERKECKDFVHSLMSRRLFQQLVNVKEAFPDSQHMFLIHGNWRSLSRYSKFDMPAALSALASLMIDWKVQFAQFSNIQDAVLFLYSLAKRVSKPKVDSVLVIPKPRLRSVEEQAIYFLSSLPHIGGARAKKLLAQGKPLDVLTLLEIQDLGLPSGVREDILKVLEYRD